VSDSSASRGSDSGATPNEKSTCDGLTVNTPRFVLESDVTLGSFVDLVNRTD